MSIAKPNNRKLEYVERIGNHISTMESTVLFHLPRMSAREMSVLRKLSNGKNISIYRVNNKQFYRGLYGNITTMFENARGQYFLLLSKSMKDLMKFSKDLLGYNKKNSIYGISMYNNVITNPMEIKSLIESTGNESVLFALRNTGIYRIGLICDSIATKILMSIKEKGNEACQ